MKKTILLPLVASLALAACGSFNKVDSAGQIHGEMKWPSHSATTLPTTNAGSVGVSKSDADLLLLRKGMNKADTWELLGRPHYREGLFGVREHNYIINNHCDLKLLFDKQDNLVSWHWKTAEGCDPALKQAAPAAPKGIPEEMKKIALNGDTLFAFDSSDLSVAGKADLDSKIISKLAKYTAEGYTFNSVVITGHTDRLGGEDYNNTLSQKRAASVAEYLNSQGVPLRMMQAYGAGSAEPVVQCEGSRPNAALKSCLQPNRRVTIEIN